MRAFIAAAAVSALAASSAALAQAFPTKPIRIIIPYGAGGTSDILARGLAPKLQEAFGQPIVVENKPGANGNVGADFVAKSAPDGTTVLLADIGALAISPSVYPKLPFDVAKDFSPVVMISYSPHVVAVHPSVPVQNLKELIAYAKANPDKLNFAISGVGGAPHLAGIEFSARTGVKWAYIPYKGGAPAVADTVAGQANVVFNGMLATWPSVTGGKLRALAVTSAQRVPSAPDTPTVAETLPGFETGSFQGVVGPAGIPREVVARLNAEFAKAVNTPDSKERLARQGTEVRTGTPEQFGEFIRSDMARWAKVVKDSGAKFD